MKNGTSFGTGNGAAIGHGRPRKENSLTHILRIEAKKRDVTIEIVNKDGTPGTKRVSYKLALAKKILDMALKGDFPAMRYVYDRLDGMPKQSMEIEHDVQGQIVLVTGAYADKPVESEAGSVPADEDKV